MYYTEGMKTSVKTLIEKKHEGKWIALSADSNKILGYAKDLVSLEKKVGREGVIFTKALRANTSYVF